MKKRENIPKTMKAIELTAYRPDYSGLRVTEKEVPIPGHNEVLVQIDSSPINPSDLMFISGTYIKHKPLPVIPGTLASGIVVAAGRSPLALFFKGKRVCCAPNELDDGPWAEYMLTSPAFCFPLKSYIDIEQGSNLLSNPATAWGMMEVLKRERHKAVIQTAAAGDLGRIILKLGQQFNIPVINIVRSEKQIELLKSLGAQYILTTEDKDFDAQLKARCDELKATIAFDAVAGNMTERLLIAMPERSKVLIYGRLSGEKCQFDGLDTVVAKEQAVEGFAINHWFQNKSLLKTFLAISQLQSFMRHEIQMEVKSRVSLEDTVKNLQQYSNGTTSGKILIKPELETGAI